MQALFICARPQPQRTGGAHDRLRDDHMSFTQQFFVLGIVVGMTGFTAEVLAQGSEGSLTCGGYEAIRVQYLGLNNNVIEFPTKDKLLSQITTIRILISAEEARRIDKFGRRAGGEDSRFSICLDGQERGNSYTSVKMSDIGNRTLLFQVDTSSADEIKNNIDSHHAILLVGSDGGITNFTYEQFLKALKENNVHDVHFSGREITGHFLNLAMFHGMVPDVQIALEKLKNSGVVVTSDEVK